METQTVVQDQILLAAQNKEAAPHIPGYKKVWVDEFKGPSGTAPNPEKWKQIDTWHWSWRYNNEKQAYTNWTENTYLSGEGELHIVPKRVTPVAPGGASWASGRIECKESWRCEPREKMIFQAEIKLGEDQHQMGIWPAFWALGKCINDVPATPWPKCGEWDIMEVVNGRSINHGTPHFSYNLAPQFYDAGADIGKFSRTVDFDRSRWHTFGFRVNRTPDPFEEETLTWYVDGKKYFQLTGADVGQKEAWVSLARRAFFPILNVAVGGEFPDYVPGPDGVGPMGRNGTPTNETQGGPGCGMKVRYVAVYKSVP